MLTGNVKHLIERKMDDILTTFQRNDERVFCHECNFKYSEAKVLMISSLGDDDMLQELYGIGAQGVLFKPLTREANFKYSIVEVEGESNMFTLDKLLQQAEEIVQKKKRKHRRSGAPAGLGP